MGWKPTKKLVHGIIDISHHNGNVNLIKARDSGVVGVVIKATQNVNWFDNTFNTNWSKATKAELMKAAYHFATYADGKAQANWFLDHVKPDDKTICVLDWEDNPKGADLKATQAIDFVNRIKQATGRYPWIYSAAWILNPTNAKLSDTLKACPLWTAGYVSWEKFKLAEGWPLTTLWQYTNGKDGMGPKVTPGISPTNRGDRSVFNGNIAGLQALWGDTISQVALDAYNAANYQGLA